MLDSGMMKEGVEKIKENIAVLEESIGRDRDTIRQYQGWLSSPGSGGYNQESLENGIQQLKVNIVAVETAIEGEYQRISELRKINDTLERKHMEAEIAKQNIIIKH